MCADARVMEFLGGTYDREKAAAMGTRMRERLERDGYGWWVLEVKNIGPFAGVIVLQDVPFEAHFTPALEVGWWLAHDYWGRGYVTEAARLALDFAFAGLGRSEVVALTAALNVRSQRVMQRLGMTNDRRDDFEHPWVETGPLRPHVLYRLKAPSGDALAEDCKPGRRDSKGSEPPKRRTAGSMIDRPWCAR
jgi:ribosomal-protein-alanine N-acetyltransferase